MRLTPSVRAHIARHQPETRDVLRDAVASGLALATQRGRADDKHWACLDAVDAARLIWRDIPQAARRRINLDILKVRDGFCPRSAPRDRFGVLVSVFAWLEVAERQAEAKPRRRVSQGRPIKPSFDLAPV